MSAPLEKLLRDARIDLILSRIEKDGSILNEVINHLDHDIRSIRFNSIHVLGKVGEKSADAVSKIISCLEDDDWSICREAARSLGKIGNLAKEAVPRLSKSLKDKEESIRKEAATALGKIGNSTIESISSLIDALDDESEFVRTEVAKALGEIGSDAYEAIPKLMKRLKDVSWTVRTASAKSISQIGRGTTRAIPSLLSALEDPDWRVRYRVGNTLAEIGEEAIPSILESLTHKNAVVRKESIDILGEMKISDPKIIDSVANLLTDKVENVRGKAADGLRSIGEAAVPALTKELESVKIKFKNLYRVANLGYYILILSVIPYVFSLLFLFLFPPLWTYFLLWQPILIVLGLLIFEIGNYKELSRQTEMKIIIISALGGMGINANDAIPVLVNFLKIPEQEEEYVYSFINNIKRAFKAFSKDPLSKKASIRVESARALGKIGFNSEDTTRALEYALNDPKKKVRRETALSLGKLGESAKSAIPSLLNALKDKNPDVRWRTSEALGKIGVNTEDVISNLNELIHDEFDYVGESAINAIDSLTEE